VEALSRLVLGGAAALTLHREQDSTQVHLDDPQRFTEYQLKMKGYVPPSVSVSKWALGVDCLSFNQSWREGRGKKWPISKI
jgi:hypothetical protein